MSVNVWKMAALCFTAGTVLVTGYRVASAAGVCGNQPNMQAALDSLRDARTWLDRAEHNKGGWRDRAAQATDTAIGETQRGCGFADTH